MSLLRRVEQGQSGEPAFDWLSREHLEFAEAVATLGMPVVWYDEVVWGGLARANLKKPTYCGDGRKEKVGFMKSPKASEALNMFGGVLMPSIYEAKADRRNTVYYEDVNRAKLNGKFAGIELGGHDLNYDEWEQVHCGFGKKMWDGNLGVRFDRSVKPSGVVEIIGEENHVDLSKKHVERGWLMNYRQGYTRRPDTNLFHTDFQALALMMAQNAEDASVLSARVVNLLKPDAGIVYNAK